MHFEQDGLHLSRSGYAFFAWLLLRGRDLRDFLRHHSAFRPQLLTVPEETVTWRRQMRVWMEQHRMAVETVQDLAMDSQMAKASFEELTALHRVLQAQGISGLRDTVAFPFGKSIKVCQPSSALLHIPHRRRRPLSLSLSPLLSS